MVDVIVIRAKLDWSQKRLAKCLGCNQTTIHRIEKGAPIPGAVLRLLHRLQALVDEGRALPGMPVEAVVDLMIGRHDASDVPSLEPQSA